MVYSVSNQNLSRGMQEESMAASSAMLVTGLEKELKLNKVKIDFHDNKVDLKEIEEFVQKLNDATALEKVKKYDERNRKKGKKEEELPKRKNQKRSDPLPPAQPFEWINQPRKSFFDFIFEWEGKILREVLKFVLQPNLDELIILAQELNLDLSAWKLDKININYKGEILLNSDLSPEEKLRLLLLDELKILEIGKLLEGSLLKLAVINLRLFRVKSALKELGIKEEELDSIKLAAKRIAFLKLVASLKDAHLKRIFASSRKEFTAYSKTIKSYTQKIWKLNIDLPDVGLKWIHQRLETLALESARYKLELLRSMQKLAHDHERAKTIRWLEHAVARSV